MKAAELRDKTKEELKKILQDLQAKLVKAKFEQASRQLKNYKLIGQLKRDVARVKTILRLSK